MEWYLPVIWAALIGTAVALYVILDGFDLGTGILFPFARNERERDQMMNSIAPFWDGNETWLVLGGGGLWVAFPHAYAIIMPALYLPVIVMLLALVFRGVRLATDDGLIFTGLIVNETAEQLELMLPDATHKKIAKADVEERTPIDISPMPTGLVKTPAELRDLLNKYKFPGDTAKVIKVAGIRVD